MSDTVLDPRARDHRRARRGARAEARRVPAHPRSARARTHADRARHLLGDVERALLVQVLEEVAAHPAHHRAAGDLRPRRERRRRRHRRRPGAGLQDGEPQPPLLHRALPGRGDRRRRHPARRLHHGRPPDRRDERAFASASPTHPKTRSARARRRRRHRRLRQLLRRADRSAASCASMPPTTATAWSTPSPPASPTPTRSSTRPPRGVGMPVVYLGAKTGRDGVGGATMASRRVRRHDRREAPDRAGRRPVHREAADGGLPRADGDRRGHLDPGHGRRRPHLLGRRDGRQGRPRHPPRPRPRAGPRGGHDRLRDDAEREPGAHADGAPPREGGARRAPSSTSGTSTSPSSARRSPRTASSSASAAR